MLTACLCNRNFCW